MHRIKKWRRRAIARVRMVRIRAASVRNSSPPPPKHEAGNDTRPHVAYHRSFQQPAEAKMDDDTLTAIGELRKRVEELEDELDALKMEMKEELGKLMMKVNRLEKP